MLENVHLDNIFQESVSAGGSSLVNQKEQSWSKPIPDWWEHHQYKLPTYTDMSFFLHLQGDLKSQSSPFSWSAFHRQLRNRAKVRLLGRQKEPLPLPLPQLRLTLLKSSEVALISFHVLFRSWIQMQKNSSKDLSWVKNIGWKSLQVSLAGRKRREIREKVCRAKWGNTATRGCPKERWREACLAQTTVEVRHFEKET